MLAPNNSGGNLNTIGAQMTVLVHFGVLLDGRSRQAIQNRLEELVQYSILRIPSFDLRRVTGHTSKYYTATK